MTVRKQKKGTRNNMRNLKGEAVCHMFLQYSSTHKFPVWNLCKYYYLRGNGGGGWADSNEHASCRVNYASCVNIVCHLVAAKSPFPNFHASLSFRLAKRLSLAPSPHFVSIRFPIPQILEPLTRSYSFKR
jgi:hypothetical protein